METNRRVTFSFTREICGVIEEKKYKGNESHKKLLTNEVFVCHNFDSLISQRHMVIMYFESLSIDTHSEINSRYYCHCLRCKAEQVVNMGFSYILMWLSEILIYAHMNLCHKIFTIYASIFSGLTNHPILNSNKLKKKPFPDLISCFFKVSNIYFQNWAQNAFFIRIFVKKHKKMQMNEIFHWKDISNGVYLTKIAVYCNRMHLM